MAFKIKPHPEARITEARITEMPVKLGDPMPRIMVKFEGSNQEVWLFDYYPDKISFTAAEFIGKTKAEAARLKFNKDRIYLRS